MGATRRDGSLPRYATVFRRPGKRRKEADTSARLVTLGSSRGCGGPFGGRRGTHPEMERREDGQRESVQHQVNAVTETDAVRIAAPQPHAGSCDRAHSDLASGRKIPSWLAATHAAKVFAATSSGAGGRGLARELEIGTRKEARQLRWEPRKHTQVQLACGPTCGAPTVIGQWVPPAVLAAGESDFRIPKPAHGPTASQHGKRPSP